MEYLDFLELVDFNIIYIYFIQFVYLVNINIYCTPFMIYQSANKKSSKDEPTAIAIKEYNILSLFIYLPNKRHNINTDSQI